MIVRTLHAVAELNKAHYGWKVMSDTDQYLTSCS